MQSHQHKPKKSLGQNFLVDPNYQRKIVQSVQKNYQGQPIIEIGPGKGSITKYLIEFAERIILVEKDNVLFDHLGTLFSQEKSIEWIHQDFLKLDLSRFQKTGPHTVVANLPYNVASQIFIQILMHNESFDHLYLMFQKEVAERCLAKPKTKDFGILSIWTQLFSRAEKLFDLPPTVFKPSPRVMSSFLHFELIKTDYLQEKPFIDFVKRIFSQRRKKISTILKKDLVSRQPLPEEVIVFLDQRAEALTVEDLKTVFFAVR